MMCVAPVCGDELLAGAFNIWEVPPLSSGPLLLTGRTAGTNSACAAMLCFLNTATSAEVAVPPGTVPVALVTTECDIADVISLLDFQVLFVGPEFARLACINEVAVLPCTGPPSSWAAIAPQHAIVNKTEAKCRFNTAPPLRRSTSNQLMACARMLICLAFGPLKSALNLWNPDFAMM